MHLPIYQHPTLTVLVDDSDSFLKSLSFQLDPTLASATFHDTTSALDWLRQAEALGPNAPPLRVNFDTQIASVDRCNVAVDIEQIYKISHNKQRFQIPSVLVVDYSMPQMNGVEFCQAVRDLPCKKILFTGAADEKIAVDAFNRGLIDRYIKKSDDDALDRLEAEVLALQREYFMARSETLRDMLSLHDYPFLTDPAFASLVQELSTRYGFVEHYLFPNPSGVLFFDMAGRPTLMIVETAQSLISQYEIARDNDAPSSLLKALLECCVIPFFSDGDGMYSSAVGPDWHSYCLPAQVCKGRQTYYWALFDLPAPYLNGTVHPYQQFLRSQDGAR